MPVTRLRLAAYGVCRLDGRLLLAHYVSPMGDVQHWTLPGGGVEPGEDPYDAVVREVDEETGYRVEVERLLGVVSRVFGIGGEGDGDDAEMHAVAIYYRVRVTGGALRHEVGGSTDRAAWMAPADVPSLARSVVVDRGLALDERTPTDGHLEAAPVIDRPHS
ncbi:MAG TPA: NUDIX hydrolase [Acidimicrobiales bacterium]|jgi:ADP-ribose pyrophosphatase YjhB (NUDIX family)|nr:NUDIX hydrolase [Acidimicrobiales bacterium]